MDAEEFDEEEYGELAGSGLYMVTSYTPDGEEMSAIVNSDPLLDAGSIKLYFDQ